MAADKGDSKTADHFEQQRVSYNDMKTRFGYFLISAAAVSLGYGLQVLSGRSVTGYNAMGHIALVAWLISICGGLYCMKFSHVAIAADIRLQHVRSRVAPETVDPELLELMGSTRDKLSRNQRRSMIAQQLQWWCLLGGAVLFVSYHFAQAFSGQTSEGVSRANGPEHVAQSNHHQARSAERQPCASLTTARGVPPGCEPRVDEGAPRKHLGTPDPAGRKAGGAPSLSKSLETDRGS